MSDSGKTPEADMESSRPAPNSTTPPFRRLRVFAFDPLLSTQLDTQSINQITLRVPWEDKLLPGPVGEYLDVHDFDPEEAKTHEPVDLDHPHLLATDGLPPSDGNMRFHQQMVYAVAMMTIQHFEHALGRKALWAPNLNRTGVTPKSEFVQRLRIYPHGLPGDRNAFYSPDRKAIYFGYFQASLENPGRNLPGGMVYTCLSHDVIAHEVTHALLDGIHQRFVEPSNVDALAFHEAFADIVAIFQHFTFTDVLRHQIGRTRGNLTDQNLLSQLAVQFGEAIGTGGALRDALAKPDPMAIQKILAPHKRGAILVAAVFDAFLSIYNRRSTDLMRIATGGSGILPAGELHPDLVNRLAKEASKSAEHVLAMCIRALDYCPPVDINFGTYLRALITADSELIHDDDLGYRLAVTEAFRRRGIFPTHVRSLSPDNLIWQSADDPTGGLITDSIKESGKDLLRRLNQWNLSASRERVFQDARNLRGYLHGIFAKLHNSEKIKEFEMSSGLAMTKEAPWSIPRSKEDGFPSFEIHSVRPARRVGPDGQLLQSLIVEITQRRHAYLDPARQQQADLGELSDSELEQSDFIFRGGCTLIYDLETANLKYCIKKSIYSNERLERQRALLGGSSGKSNLAYFSQGEPFAMLHENRPDR
jgi:hypothetical protein